MNITQLLFIILFTLFELLIFIGIFEYAVLRTNNNSNKETIFHTFKKEELEEAYLPEEE